MEKSEIRGISLVYFTPFCSIDFGRTDLCAFYMYVLKSLEIDRGIRIGQKRLGALALK